MIPRAAPRWCPGDLGGKFVCVFRGPGHQPDSLPLPGTHPHHRTIKQRPTQATSLATMSKSATYPGTRQRRRPLLPGAMMAVGFAAAIGVGTALLELPFARQEGADPRFIDAMFTATSAVTVTGLVTVDPGTTWTGFGQAVILALIQIGGFGMVTTGTLIMLFVSRRLGLATRLAAQAETPGVSLGGRAPDSVVRAGLHPSGGTRRRASAHPHVRTALRLRVVAVCLVRALPHGVRFQQRRVRAVPRRADRVSG